MFIQTLKLCLLLYFYEDILSRVLLFSANIFKTTFPSLSNITPEVLYPIPDFSAFEKPTPKPTPELMPADKFVFTSINRYERKKDLGLAIKAFG